MEVEEPQSVNDVQNLNFLQQQNEPSISFSPNKNRFGGPGLNSSMDINDLLLGNKEPVPSTSSIIPNNQNYHEQEQEHVIAFRGELKGNGGTQLQKRLERHIANANVNGNHSQERSRSQSGSSSNTPATVINPGSRNGKAHHVLLMSPNHSSSGPDIRNKGNPGTLIPPCRLKIPRKPNSNTISSTLSTHLHTLEAKPLVQWDTDDSEEELSSFFPKPKARLTDNLSIDNLSMEEEDLHLTPPRPLMSKGCPCDPRPFIQSQLNSVGRLKQCRIT